MVSASRPPNFALLVAAAWLLLALALLLQYWPGTVLSLNDTDDAMRFVEVREFLAGHGWFDLHMARVQPPLGYDPHWSRLIDAGLAGTFLLFHQFVDTPLAERLMRATWPLLWLLPAIVGAAAIAWRLAGREAAMLVLLFAVIGLPAMQQFKPGRIDHHNVQIAIALLTVAATVWTERLRWTAMAAGCLSGLGLAIGFEGAAFLVLCGAALAIRYVVDGTSRDNLRDYGLAVALSTAAAFFVSVGPGHWLHTACDAIAINSTAAMVIGGAALALASRVAAPSWATRLIVTAAAGLAAAAVFVWIEPRCLGGPYAMVDPAVKPIWLANVQEMQPLPALFGHSPAAALGIAAFPVTGIAAVVVLALRPAMRRDFAFLVSAAALLLAAAITCAAIKGYCYAVWLAMPSVAVLALRLFQTLRVERLLPRFLIALLLTPAVLSGGVIGIAEAAGLHHDNDTAIGDVCFKSASYAPFRSLKPGLVATSIDYGPFLLALTPHAVLAAPYHRLSVGIIAAHRIFTSPPDEARRILTREHVTYLATCGAHAPAGLSEAQRQASLWGQLHAGAVPDWLAREPSTPEQAFSIYRVKP